MSIKKNNIVSETELEQIYQKMLKISQETGSGFFSKLNAYDAYIIECEKNRTEQEPTEPKPYLEKHHIVPRFEKKPETANDIVSLTIKEHVIAHWLRWKVLGKTGDLRAFLFRIGDTEQASALKLKAVKEARERDKLERRQFSDPDFQRQQGLKGGKKGGSRNTLEQFRARQKVGEKWGPVVGRSNQGESLKEFIQSHTLWGFSQKAASGVRTKTRDDEEFFLIEPKDTFVAITKVLNDFHPNSIRTVAAMHKVVYGARPQMYGWRIVSMLTRSEVSEGIQEFQEENPEAIITFEVD